MRRFEFSDGKSNKFWEIEVAGSGFTTRHGRIGTDGRETSKQFGSPDAAAKQAASAIASMCARLQEALPHARIDDQKQDADDRYVSVGE